MVSRFELRTTRPRAHTRLEVIEGTARPGDEWQHSPKCPGYGPEVCGDDSCECDDGDVMVTRVTQTMCSPRGDVEDIGAKLSPRSSLWHGVMHRNGAVRFLGPQQCGCFSTTH